MFLGDGISRWMDCFAPLKTYCNEGDGDWSRYASGGSNLYLALQSWQCCADAREAYEHMLIRNLADDPNKGCHYVER